MSANYKEIFEKFESSLRVNMKKYDHDMDAEFKDAKELTYTKHSDDWYFEVLKMIPFYAGFKASTVKKKIETINYYLPNYVEVAKYDEKDVVKYEKNDLLKSDDNIIAKMMNDPDMIKRSSKINSVIHNAKKFKEIVKEHGSIHNYFEKFKPNESIENLNIFAKHIRSPFFKYLGKVTISHFLTEIGLNALKPDRVVQRIYHRLNLIDSITDIDKSIELGRKFSEATGLPIRYIDIVFVVYGQIEKYAICTDKNPKCNLCDAHSYCSYEKKNRA